MKKDGKKELVRKNSLLEEKKPMRKKIAYNEYEKQFIKRKKIIAYMENNSLQGK